jgi:serine/threonine protein kinase
MLLSLSHLHGLGIVHRDLKPENLLVELNQPQNKLALVSADFGLSKMLTRPDDLLGTFCGTRFYAAPDILPIYGNSGYGAKVDIWAAGVIMLQCIWGLPEAPDLPPG